MPNTPSKCLPGMLVDGRAKGQGEPLSKVAINYELSSCDNTSLHAALRYHIIGFHPKSYAWWGGLSYTIGAVQYNIAATTGFADNFPRVYAAWSATTYKWASTVMYTWGGGFFLISGLCYVMLDMGVSGIWLGKHNRVVCSSVTWHA